jgi:hypothetical protein
MEERVFEAEPTLPPAAPVPPPPAPVPPPPAPEPALVPVSPAFDRGAGPPEAALVVEAGPPGATPFSSSTLAELYLKQGLVDRAVAVYRRVIAEEPDNDRARSRLAEIERAASSADDRAARRRALERTIAGLEALLGAVQRR